MPADLAHLVRRAARAAPLRRAGAGLDRRPAGGRPPARAVGPRLPGSCGRQSAAAGRGRDVLHLRHHGQAQGRGAHALHLARPCRRRRALRQAHGARGGAGLSAAGLDRPEHLQLCAVAGVRLRRQLPRVGRDGDDRPEGDRPDLLLRAAARVRGPADDGDDPHGGCLAHQALAVPARDGPGAPRRPGHHGRQAGRGPRPPEVPPGQPADLRPAAQHAGHEPGARGLHRRRGHRPGPVHLLSHRSAST